MPGWFHLRFGFSAVGLLFLLCLFVPNILFALQNPEWISDPAVSEPSGLLVPERIGQVLVCLLILFDGTLRWPRTWSAQVWWLAAAGVCMALYLASWVRYFTEPSQTAFYEPFLGIPLPLAVLPVASAVLLGIYDRSFWLVLASAILGYGHIGIHVWHVQQLREVGAGF